MLSKLGENYPYKRDRSAPGLIKIQKNESRNYNIITCLDKIPLQQSRNTDSLPSIALPKQRKLGEYKDFPYPKNRKDCESNISFNPGMTKKSEFGNDSAARTEYNQSRLTNPNFQAQNLMNSSSVPFNFVTNTIIENPKTIKELRSETQGICNRTKQIGSIYDQGRLFAPNFNPEYQSFFKTNLQSFHRNKGMCADTYNRAHTYGPGLKPFRKFK